jgi:hypothetical protein
MALLHITKY